MYDCIRVFRLTCLSACVVLRAQVYGFALTGGNQLYRLLRTSLSSGQRDSVIIRDYAINISEVRMCMGMYPDDGKIHVMFLAKAGSDYLFPTKITYGFDIRMREQRTATTMCVQSRRDYQMVVCPILLLSPLSFARHLGLLCSFAQASTLDLVMFILICVLCSHRA